MSNSSTGVGGNTTTTTTTTTTPAQNIAGAIESAVTSNIFQTLSDLYSGNTSWYWSLATYLVTLAIAYFILFWVWGFVKAILGGVRDVGTLLTGGKVGGEGAFEPLPQIEDADDETQFAVD